MKIAVSFFLVCFSHSAVAETYKCIQSGRTIYSSSPCGDNVHVVQEHFTVTQELPRKIYKEHNSVQSAPPQSLAAPVKAVAPAQVAAPVINCDYQEAAFEDVKKGMRAGYPASQSNYWLGLYKKARDAYDLCREQRHKGIGGKQ